MLESGPELPRLTLDEVADGAGALELSESGLPLHPVAVVDLGGKPSPALVAASARAARASGRVLVGVAEQTPPEGVEPLLDALTFTLGPGPSATLVPHGVHVLAELAAAASAAPRAAVTLVRLLRLTSVTSVADGLVAESMAYSTLLAGPEFAAWRGATPRRTPVASPEPQVLVDRSGDTLRLTLNRPGRHNAYGRLMRDGLVEGLELALADPSLRRVELTGNGRSFCSGGDLDEFGTTPDVATAHVVRVERSAGRLLDACRDRVVARVHGACIGAGVELSAFAGRVEAHPDTFFQLPELRMGLVPGAGGTVSLTHRIGRWRTAYLALTGCRLDAATALQWGLVDALAS